MSVHVSSWAWKVKAGLSSGEKLVLLKLADMANDDGECWPSQVRIADDCELSERQVRRALKNLEEKELLEIRPRYVSDGDSIRRRTNLYILKISAGHTVPDKMSVRPALAPMNQPAVPDTDVRSVPDTDVRSVPDVGVRVIHHLDPSMIPHPVSDSPAWLPPAWLDHWGGLNSQEKNELNHLIEKLHAENWTDAQIRNELEAVALPSKIIRFFGLAQMRLLQLVNAPKPQIEVLENALNWQEGSLLNQFKSDFKAGTGGARESVQLWLEKNATFAPSPRLLEKITQFVQEAS